MGKLVCAHVNNLFSYPETLQDCINPTRPRHRVCLALEGQQKRLAGVCCFSVCGELFCVRGPGPGRGAGGRSARRRPQGGSALRFRATAAAPLAAGTGTFRRSLAEAPCCGDPVAWCQSLFATLTCLCSGSSFIFPHSNAHALLLFVPQKA